MPLRISTLFLATSLLLLASATAAWSDSGDVAFGYSRAGANLYAPNTPGMNGWQLAAQVRTFPFVGFEGDLSHYGATVGAGTQNATLYMFGPRLTVGTMGYSVFVHALGGIAHVTSNPVAGFPASSSNTISYALGGGVDLPLYHLLKFRISGDDLGDGNEPSSPYSPSHFRIGVGLALHF